MKLSLTLYSTFLITSLLFSSCANVNRSSKTPEEQAEPYIQMGTSALMKKEFPQAIQDFRKALKLVPNHPIAHNHLGLAYFGIGKRDLAKIEIQKSVVEDPNYSDGYINLGNFAADENNYTLAKHYYNKALQNLEYKERYRALTNLGHIELKQNNLDKAKDYFFESLSFNSEYCMTHFLLGTVYTRKNNLKEAANSFHKSILKTCVNNPEAHYQLGVSYMRLKKYDKAKSEFVYLIQEQPQSIQAQKAGEHLRYLP